MNHLHLGIFLSNEFSIKTVGVYKMALCFPVSDENTIR